MTVLCAMAPGKTLSSERCPPPSPAPGPPSSPHPHPHPKRPTLIVTLIPIVIPTSITCTTTVALTIILVITSHRTVSPTLIMTTTPAQTSPNLAIPPPPLLFTHTHTHCAYIRTRTPHLASPHTPIPPLVDKRYHKIGCDYDLNETEFRKLSRAEQVTPRHANPWSCPLEPGPLTPPHTRTHAHTLPHTHTHSLTAKALRARADSLLPIIRGDFCLLLGVTSACY